MCRHTIKVSWLETRPNNSGRLKCEGSIRGAYLHTGTRSDILNALEDSLIAGKQIEVEVVRGAVVKVYDGSQQTTVSKQKARPTESLKRTDSLNFLNIGGYGWLCVNCQHKIYAVSQPRFCPNCGVI